MNHALVAVVTFVIGSFSGAPARAASPAAPAATAVAGSSVAPHAVTLARTTTIPDCTVFVDAASASGKGTAQNPHTTIAAAVKAAQEGAVICVAQGNYAEQLKPGQKGFTLAGGFQSGKAFRVRDSALYITKARGDGSGSFLRIEDPGPKGVQLTAIDGFEISGFARAILREHWESQRFDITNNNIHDNKCADETMAGAGFSLNNVSGTIKGNVIARNSCGRGGAGFLNDSTNQNTVSIENNRVDGNAGTEPGTAHGGGLYFFGNTLRVTGNEFINNSVTQWGGGLYIGAYIPGNQPTTAAMSWNVYRGNRAGNAGGGFFCDDGATCISSHEIYDKNCGGNILVDGGFGGPTTTRFDHITNVGALTADCSGPGIGFLVDNSEVIAPDSHTISNSIFWGNAEGQDFAVACGAGCGQLKIRVEQSMVQTKYGDGSIKIKFGPGIVPPADPLFVAPDKGDFHLKAGSPAIAKGSEKRDLGAYDDGLAAAPASADTVPAVPAPGATSAPVPAVPAPVEAGTAAVQAGDISIKEAFEAAKELGTVEGWNAFLSSYPTGFLAELARAHVKKLGGAAR